MDACRDSGKPCLVIDLAGEANLAAAAWAAREWVMAALPGGCLNVAGPRAGEEARVYERAKAFMWAVLGGGDG